jgi:signal transduction histidine kinase
MNFKLSKFVNLPFFISLAVYIAIVSLLPPLFQKYRLEPIRISNSQGRTIMYADLNSDNISETVIKNSYGGNNAFIYTDNAGYVMEQLNMKKKIPEHHLSAFEDFDDNGFSEHYFLTMSKDSIFLNAVEYPNLSTPFIKDRFITTIEKNIHGSYDFSAETKNISRDINQDGYKEILFNITAGFSYRPRAMYAYDVKNDSLYVYDADGIHFFPEYFFDFNDGKSEKLIFSSFATDNHRDREGVAHPDTAAWLLLCDKQLREAFEPIPIGKSGTHLQAAPIKKDNSDQFDLFVLQSQLRQKSSVTQAYLFSSDGSLSESKALPELKGKFFVLLKNPANYNHVAILDPQGTIHKYDNELNRVGKINQIPVSESTENLKPTIYYTDIDKNGDQETIISYNKVITVLDKRLKHPASLTLESKRATYFSTMTNSDNETHISFTSENNTHYLLRYKEDRLYPYRFLIYTAAFLGLYFFFVIIIQIRTRAIRAENKKLEALAAKRTKEIEKQKNQLDRLNQQLQISNEELQEKNIRLLENQQFKQMVTAMIVHDLKVPLNTINQSVSDSDSKTAIGKMLLLIDNIIDIYKLDEKKISLKKNVINIAAAFDKSMVHLKRVILQKNISVDLDIFNDLCVEADQHLFERIILNLLSNAVKYSPNNGRINILAEPQDADVLIAVSNSVEELSENAFQYLQNTFTSEKKESLGIAKSSGIGLQFCKLALEAHNKKLIITKPKESQITFSFRLPSAICASTGRQLAEIKKAPVIMLSEENRKFLQPYISKLQKLEPYQATEVNRILTKIPENRNDNIKKWLDQLRNAIFTINSEEYHELLK